MARISYADGSERPELAARIAGKRGGLINVYRLLLHSPELAEPWFELINGTRKTKLSGRLREIAIVRIAQRARYAYALQQHVPAIALADGMTAEECKAVKDWQASRLFGPRERALLAYVDAMIAGPDISDGTFEPLRAHFDDREILELTVITGIYIMHHRVFSALRVDLEPGPR